MSAQNDYWTECIGIAAEECDLKLTPEQLTYLAEAVEGKVVMFSREGLATHDAKVRRRVLEEFAYKWLPNLRDTAPESSLHKMTHNMAIDDAIKHALRMAQEQPK